MTTNDRCLYCLSMCLSDDRHAGIGFCLTSLKSTDGFTIIVGKNVFMWNEVLVIRGKGEGGTSIYIDFCLLCPKVSISRYENVWFVCLSVCLLTFFSAILNPICIQFGTKFHFGPVSVLKQQLKFLKSYCSFSIFLKDFSVR